MPSITFDDFSDGEVLTATKLNTQFEKVETLINTDLLDNSNLENPDFFISYPFYIASVSSTTLRPKIRFPVSATYTYVDLSFVAHTVSAGSTFQVDLLDNSGSSVLSSVLQLTSAGNPHTQSFSPALSALGGEINTIQISRTAGSGSADDVTIILTVKTELTD